MYILISDLEKRKGSFNERRNKLHLSLVLPPPEQARQMKLRQPLVLRRSYGASVFDIGTSEGGRRLREHLEASNARYLARRAGFSLPPREDPREPREHIYEETK